MVDDVTKSKTEQLNAILDNKKKEEHMEKIEQQVEQNDILVKKIEALEKQVNELTIEKEQLQKDLAESKSAVALAQADMQNLIRRTAIDEKKARDFAIEKFAKELIAVGDSFSSGLDHQKSLELDGNALEIQNGFKLTFDLFNNILSNFDIKVIAPIAEKFDPKEHEALSMQVSDDYESGTILQVIQNGYSLKDRLLRPARVIVSK